MKRDLKEDIYKKKRCDMQRSQHKKGATWKESKIGKGWKQCTTKKGVTWAQHKKSLGTKRLQYEKK